MTKLSNKFIKWWMMNFFAIIWTKYCIKKLKIDLNFFFLFRIDVSSEFQKHVSTFLNIFRRSSIQSNFFLNLLKKNMIQNHVNEKFNQRRKQYWTKWWIFKIYENAKKCLFDWYSSKWNETASIKWSKSNFCFYRFDDLILNRLFDILHKIERIFYFFV